MALAVRTDGHDNVLQCYPNALLLDRNRQEGK